MPSWPGVVRSSYFRLEEVAGGVFAAVVTPGVGAMGNAAIVDLGERTLVFDTFLTTPAARELREIAERSPAARPASWSTAIATRTT